MLVSGGAWARVGTAGVLRIGQTVNVCLKEEQKGRGVKEVSTLENAVVIS